MINNNTILNDKKVIPLYEGGVSHNFRISLLTKDYPSLYDIARGRGRGFKVPGSEGQKVFRYLALLHYDIHSLQNLGGVI